VTSRARWEVSIESGSAAELHALEVPASSGRILRVCEPVSPAVVLGSSQTRDLVDGDAADAAGVEVARRSSGGGAVHVTPDDDVWLDIILPAGDPLALDDVGRAFWWLGEVCAGVVAGTGATPRIHRGGWEPGPAGRLVCFAGLGPGEVTVAGRKVVGISQRRTRAWSRLSVSVLTHWDPSVLEAVLVGLSTGDPGWLADVAVGLPVRRERLRDALVEAVTAF
jgi:lipoate-protein ligase A